MAATWTAQRERGNRFALQLLKWIALGLGRRALQVILVPIVTYFVLFSRSSRQASENYLARVLGRKAGWSEVWKHFYTFALVSVDRFYFLSDRYEPFTINLNGEEVFEQAVKTKQGCILLVSHMGSFDVMRAPAVKQHQLPIRILMDKQHNARAMALLESLSPELAKGVLDSRMSAPELSLKLDACLKQGEFIGIMADRIHEGDKAESVAFLGGEASLPTGPWLLSMVLKAPVILCFGLYKGNGQYDVFFERIDQHLNVPRKQRNQALQQAMAYYASRLEFYIKQAPYNWFNFYEFWSNESSSNN